MDISTNPAKYKKKYKSLWQIHRSLQNTIYLCAISEEKPLRLE